MGDICNGVESKKGKSPLCESSQQAARWRRIEIRRSKFTGVPTPENDNGQTRQKLECSPSSASFLRDGEQSRSTMLAQLADSNMPPKFGFASARGARKNMEDAVAALPSFCRREDGLHYFGVYDGHGCSHVAMKCVNRLHEVVKEELASNRESTDWERTMERSFLQMDREVIVRDGDVSGANCRCQLQKPECDSVGSTAVVSIVTPGKIIVANSGDSRAVLCCNGKAVPLSIDHKPDRPDELNRIEAAGGRVIFWDCPRVEGVLAMSRAIGDDYLKPYVICEPEVRIIDRTAGDNFLILGSDGLWDVVSNEMACRVVRGCLKVAGGEISDQTCSDASRLLAKLALLRHSTDNVSVVVISLKNT